MKACGSLPTPATLQGCCFPWGVSELPREICPAQTHRTHVWLSHRWHSCLPPQSCLMAMGDISQFWSQRMWSWPESVNSAQLKEVPQGTTRVGRKTPQVLHTHCYFRTLTFMHMWLFWSHARTSSILMTWNRAWRLPGCCMAISLLDPTVNFNALPFL